MRATSLVVAAGCMLAACPLAAEEFPFTAYATAHDVYVRSGPGRNYYPTDKLQKGDPIEVYRKDPGGWCAVRPPEGSFSWVSSRYIRSTTDGLGVVMTDQTVARVGSKFSSVRDVIQVRLDKDELVEILEEHNSGGQTWYKIAPPSGEFRWVSSRYLHDKPPHDGVSEPRSLSQDEAEYDDREFAARDDREYDQYEDEADYDNEDGVRVARSSRDDSRRDGNVRRADYIEDDAPEEKQSWRGERQAAHNDDARRSPRSEPTNVRRPTRPRDQPRELSADAFQFELDDIEAELSAMVAEEPTVWTFHDMKDRAARLEDNAGAALERGQARRVINKIARLEDIRKRYATVNEIRANTDRQIGRAEAAHLAGQAAQNVTPAGFAPAGAAPGATAGRVDAPGGASDFDGQGILRPVVSRRLDAPRYALVDELGVVQSFLSPAPGLNLQPYLGQPVGVNGARGFMPELRKPHVMVQRIKPLVGTMR
jgi:uncharacterized protein YraI